MDTFQPAANTAACRVLLVDDDPEIRFITRRILAEYGCVVESAADGREALQLLLSYEYDVAVVDIVMDVMDGFTFLEEALKICPWLGVVVITGLVDPGIIQQVRAFGPFTAVHKPIIYEKLVDEIRCQAKRKSEYLEKSENQSLLRVQYQVSILRGICETALNLKRFIDAMRHLAMGLSRLLPNAVMSIVGHEDGKDIVIHEVNEPVNQAYLDFIEKSVLDHYERLTGIRLNTDNIRRSVEGRATLDPESSVQCESMANVPIISGGKVLGIISLTATAKDAYDPVDKFFLYHAANHLSMVIAIFRRLENLATVDALTGLYNRRRLDEELSRTMDLSRRYGHPVSIVFMDIDHFKSINDIHGHSIGDRLLQEVSILLRNASRVSDFVSRIGGDEFVAILPQSDTAAAQEYAQRLVSEIGTREFCGTGLRLRVTVSAGIATGIGTGDNNMDQALVHQADQAMYKAKRDGRNQCAIYEPDSIGASDDSDHSNSPKILDKQGLVDEDSLPLPPPVDFTVASHK